MKNLLLLLLFTTLSLNAQTKDCIYDIEEKTDSTSLKSLPHKLMNEKILAIIKNLYFLDYSIAMEFQC